MFHGDRFLAGKMALSCRLETGHGARRPDFPREPRTPWADMPSVLGRALLPLALPGILLGLIYSGVTTPTEAAAIAASYALVLAFVVYRTLHVRQLLAVISETVQATAMIALIMAGALLFYYAGGQQSGAAFIRHTLLGRAPSW